MKTLAYILIFIWLSVPRPSLLPPFWSQLVQSHFFSAFLTPRNNLYRHMYIVGPFSLLPLSYRLRAGTSICFYLLSSENSIACQSNSRSSSKAEVNEMPVLVDVLSYKVFALIGAAGFTLLTIAFIIGATGRN